MNELVDIADLMAVTSEKSAGKKRDSEYEPKLSVGAAESKIFELEGVRIIIRTPKTSLLRRGYHYQTAIGGNFPLSMLVNRIKESLGLSILEYTIIDGRGQTRHNMDVALETLRNSYTR